MRTVVKIWGQDFFLVERRLYPVCYGKDVEGRPTARKSPTYFAEVRTGVDDDGNPGVDVIISRHGVRIGTSNDYQEVRVVETKEP